MSTRILRFRSLNAHPRPAKAQLRADVQQSVHRSIQKLPTLGEQNPDAAMLIERSIDDWMPPPPDHPADARTVDTAADTRLEPVDPLLAAIVTEAWETFSDVATARRRRAR
jgi:hypothetical protein